jgi:hypothetical protein
VAPIDVGFMEAHDPRAASTTTNRSCRRPSRPRNSAEHVAGNRSAAPSEMGQTRADHRPGARAAGKTRPRRCNGEEER